jgi:hypothetical protein
MKSISLVRDSDGNLTGATVREVDTTAGGDEVREKLEMLIQQWNRHGAADGTISKRLDTLERKAAALSAMFSDEESELSKTIKVIVDAVAELQKSALRYRGVWGGVATSPAYVRNDTVTCNGSLWICHRDAPGRPGDGPASGWALAVKQGACNANT